MNTFFENPLYILNTILTLFRAKRAEYSVNDLAMMLYIPAGVVRDDILALHNNKEVGITFSSAGDEEIAESDITSLLASGEFDDTKLVARAFFRMMFFCL